MVRPFQVTATAALPLATVQLLTCAPPASTTRVTIDPGSRFVAVRLTVSRTPSPLGENHWVVLAAGVRPASSGAAVSTVSSRVARAGPLPHGSTPLTLTW